MQPYLLIVALAACISSGFTFKITPTDDRSYSESQSLNADSSDVRQHCRSLCSAVRTRSKRDYCIVECELSSSARLTIPEYIRRCVVRRCSDLDATGEATFSERYVTCMLDKCLYSLGHGAEKRSAAVGVARVVPSKRSWTDLMAACIEHHCSHQRPGSIQYHVCGNSYCNSSYTKR